MEVLAIQKVLLNLKIMRFYKKKMKKTRAQALTPIEKPSKWLKGTQIEVNKFFEKLMHKSKLNQPIMNANTIKHKFKS